MVGIITPPLLFIVPSRDLATSSSLRHTRGQQGPMYVTYPNRARGVHLQGGTCYRYPLMPSRSMLQTMWRESGLACFQVNIPVKTAVVLFNNPLKHTLQLSWATLLCWLHSVQEAILTREQREEAAAKQAKTTLLRFLQWRDTTNRGLFSPLYSNVYYTKPHTGKTAHKGNSNSSKHIPTIPVFNAKIGFPGATVPRPMNRGANHRKHKNIPKQPSWNFGFKAVTKVVKASKQIVEAVQNLEEYSGTRLSTAPWMI